MCIKAMDLSVLTGYEHETWALGDTVMVKDDDLNLSVKTRIVRREYNLQEALEYGAGTFHYPPGAGRFLLTLG